ncbi:MAG: hypothetical protein ABIN67_07600 [Ferruginibacter sp.]
MENSSNNFAADMACITELENYDSVFNTPFADSPGPDDEDEEEGEEAEQSEEVTNDDDNPPMDNEIVHSPVTTQNGGRAK